MIQSNNSPKGEKHMAIYTINQIKETIEPIAKEYGVDQIYLFGSYSRGEATEQSDIDLYVYPGDIRFLRVCAMEADIESQIGKKIDTIVNGCMKLFFPLNIQEKGVLLYDKK
jgi:predicted nucleotidyltransferase